MNRNPDIHPSDLDPVEKAKLFKLVYSLDGDADDYRFLQCFIDYFSESDPNFKKDLRTGFQELCALFQKESSSRKPKGRGRQCFHITVHVLWFMQYYHMCLVSRT